MATVVHPFSDEQARVLINLQQQYEVWMEAERALASMPYNLVRKEVNGYSYLYEVKDRANNARSLGPWSDENAARPARSAWTKPAGCTAPCDFHSWLAQPERSSGKPTDADCSARNSSSWERTRCRPTMSRRGA